MPERESRPRRTRTTRTTRTGGGHAAVDARQACAAAARYAVELTKGDPEGVTSLERTEDGWRIGVEVVESRRIPDSTDILAVYQIIVDDHGGLVSYRRERRYHRGRVDGESSE